MKHITLCVTEAVVQHVNNVGVNKQAGQNQRQITIQDGSPDLLDTFRVARKDNQVLVPVSGVFELSVGDTSAIWATHQTEGLQAEDFTSLYDLLARRPGRPVRMEITL